MQSYIKEKTPKLALEDEIKTFVRNSATDTMKVEFAPDLITRLNNESNSILVRGNK